MYKRSRIYPFQAEKKERKREKKLKNFNTIAMEKEKKSGC
jgi:hypothetical protein